MSLGPVPAILPTRPNVYTGSPLDRAAHRRDDEAWVSAAAESETALWALIRDGRNLLSRSGEATLLDGRAVAALRHAASIWSFLGLLDGRPLFALEASTVDPALLPAEDEASFADLRTVSATLAAGDAAVLAHARGLMHWRTKHRFCPICGTALTPRSAGNVLQCGGCTTHHFPRTDPAVIMLVVHGERALLAHSARFPTATMYSTLAGFVEPGESLEETVAREVFEEAGVRVHNATYHSSQPWPFPASLMIGFHAEAIDAEITIDGDEISDARWFTRAEISDPARHGFMIPRADSIARRLIEDWVALA